MLLTAALMVRLLPPPVLLSDTVPVPPAVTAAPMVSVPLVAVRPMLPLAAAVVVIAPEVVRLPVLVTLTFEPDAVPDCVIPVTVSVVSVLVRLMAPLVELVAVKLPTVFAPPNVVPVAELVVKRPVVLKEPVSVMLPAEVTVMLPDPVPTALFTAMLPDPVLVSPIVSVVVPVTAATTVNVPVVAVRLMALPAVLSATVPEVVRLPVLFTVTPPPVSVIPVSASVLAVFVRLTLPLALLEALKLVTLLVAVLRFVPVAEVVVRRLPVIAPAAVWPMLPADRVTLLPPVLTPAVPLTVPTVRAVLPSLSVMAPVVFAARVETELLWLRVKVPVPCKSRSGTEIDPPLWVRPPVLMSTRPVPLMELPSVNELLRSYTRAPLSVTAPVPRLPVVPPLPTWSARCRCRSWWCRRRCWPPSE